MGITSGDEVVGYVAEPFGLDVTLLRVLDRLLGVTDGSGGTSTNTETYFLNQLKILIEF
jgi:phage shock protein PspC (stress-responsive transcriptional regulator)